MTEALNQKLVGIPFLWCNIFVAILTIRPQGCSSSSTFVFPPKTALCGTGIYMELPKSGASSEKTWRASTAAWVGIGRSFGLLVPLDRLVVMRRAAIGVPHVQTYRKTLYGWRGSSTEELPPTVFGPDDLTVCSLYQVDPISSRCGVVPWAHCSSRFLHCFVFLVRHTVCP